MQIQADRSDAGDADLRHYLQVVVRRRWVIVASAILVGLAALGFSLTKEDRYRASGDLLLLAPTAIEADTRALSDDPERAVANEVEVLQSAEMRAAVRDRLGEDLPDVEPSAAESNDVITLQAESPDPQLAADSVNAWADAYVAIRSGDAVEELEQQLAQRSRERTRLRNELEVLERPYNDLNLRISQTPPGPALDALIEERNALIEQKGAERDALVQSIGELRTLIEDLRRALADPTDVVQVLNPATVPSEPFYPSPQKDLLVGLVLGFLLGLAVAFVWEQLDDAVRTKDDLARAAPKIAPLALIPRIEGWKGTADDGLVVRPEIVAGAAEAYRGLVTSLEFLDSAARGRLVMFTSPSPSEGKTTTVANVALGFAEAGHRVVIVDCDLRRPRLHDFYELSSAVGLTTVLAGKIDIATAVQTADAEAGVAVVTAGPIPPNPAELLRTDAFADTLTKLREAFDFVLIDTPPVLPVADAVVIARHVDSALLIAKAGSTSRRKLRHAIEALQQVDAPVRGLILNGITPRDSWEYGYYTSDYRPKKERRSRRKRRKAAARAG